MADDAPPPTTPESGAESMPESTSGEARRLRLITPQEQLEFTRIARRLLSHGVRDTELRQELGYDTDEELRRAVETGRATTARLERLRSLAWDRMHLTAPARPTGKQAGTGHIPELVEAGEAGEEGPGGSAGGGGKAQGRGRARDGGGQRRASVAGRRAGRRSGAKKRSARKEFLDPKQHAKMVEHVDHFRAVDRQYETWSLLAKVMGLASGQAAKRAYEVNSSLATLRNVERFARLLAGFGSRATRALQAGVTIDELQEFLTAGGTRGVESVRDASATGDADTDDPGADAAVAVRGGRRRRRTREAEPSAAPHAETLAAMLAASALPPMPASAVAPNLFEVAAAVDAQLARIWDSVRFFDGVARSEGLPRTVRFAAEETRDMLREAVAAFTGEEPAAMFPGEAEEDEAEFGAGAGVESEEDEVESGAGAAEPEAEEEQD
jgi:hypothetical protein